MEQGIDLSDSDLQVEGLSIDDDVGLERDEPTRWLQDSVEPTIPTRDGENIVRQIASFLTLSDAASFASSEMKRMGSESRLGETIGPVESWVSLISAATPETPGLMALSPDDFGFDDSGDWDDAAIRNRMHGRQRTWAKQRLAAAVFANPRSLRSYCLEAHRAASTIRRTRQADPETLREPEQRGLPILNLLVKSVFQNVPLVVAIDIAGAIHETALDVSFATFRISVRTINGVVDAVLSVMRALWDRITRFNPFAVLDAIISLQFNAVGRTSEALVGGIQSVATGVGSASNAALQRLSRGGDAPGGNFRSGPSSASIMNEINMRNDAYNQKLIRKLSTANSAAQVISYLERHDEALTRHAKKRVQRMMHYDVSLKPFVATVVVPPQKRETFGNVDVMSNRNHVQEEVDRREPQSPPSPSSSTSSSSPTDSPFMCTPKSFPPTPASRSMVMARGTRFAEDVVFLARDKLRIQGGLDSSNERTRAMAQALREASSLAVFNAANVGSGIALTCGQHVATKVGNVLYCSTRSMVPVLRNCFVYFEMTVLPSNMMLQTSMVTLSIGLSTVEMPLNTLVGAWKGSVGLCTTGQILAAGQWCSPSDPSLSSYGENATVGCLVCLDDDTAFETWDGVMVTASVTFNVNGTTVPPPVRTTPMVGGLVTPPTSMDPSQELLGPVAATITLPLLVPLEEELFPTLTLHSPATQVMCRFSSEDVIETSRERIGAPRGVTVYAVDGSVLLNQDE